MIKYLVIGLCLLSCVKTKTEVRTLTRDSTVIQIDSIYRVERYVFEGSRYDLVSGANYWFVISPDSTHLNWTVVIHLDSIVYHPDFIYWAPAYHYIVIRVFPTIQDSVIYSFGPIDMAIGIKTYDSIFHIHPASIDPYSIQMYRSNTSN